MKDTDNAMSECVGEEQVSKNTEDFAGVDLGAHGD